MFEFAGSTHGKGTRTGKTMHVWYFVINESWNSTRVDVLFIQELEYVNDYRVKLHHINKISSWALIIHLRNILDRESPILIIHLAYYSWNILLFIVTDHHRQTYSDKKCFHWMHLLKLVNSPWIDILFLVCFCYGFHSKTCQTWLIVSNLEQLELEDIDSYTALALDFDR